RWCAAVERAAAGWWRGAAPAARGGGAARRPGEGVACRAARAAVRGAAEAHPRDGSARGPDPRRWLPGGAGRSVASRSLLDGVGLADRVSAPLDLDLDAVGVAELLVDL